MGCGALRKNIIRTSRTVTANLAPSKPTSSLGARPFSSLLSHYPSPTSSLVAPGKCAFGSEWSPSKLLHKEQVSHDAVLLTFALPKDRSLGLSTCACILASSGIKDAEGGLVVRPYTPVSTNAIIGSFQLLVKVYEYGVMSKSLGELQTGEEVQFKHIPFNVKTQYPFKKKKIGMIAGGTGITPMLQALHAVLGTKGDDTQVSVLVGNRTREDILAGDMLSAWAAVSERLAVTHVLSEEPEDTVWEGPRGFITPELITRHLPGPSEDCMVMVCGPPMMYEAMCGPRDQENITGALAELGFASEQVYKF